MTATHAQYISVPTTRALFMALELSETSWVLAFSTAPAEAPRRRQLRARELAALDQEIARAKVRLGLPADARIYSCYEAGREGFWLTRALATRGIHNLVIDPA